MRETERNAADTGCTPQFPKGRIDSLTNHLVKKCPALPMRDRQRAILQFHELPDLPENMANGANAAAQNGQTLELPYAPKQLSALETLAEVSRQHLDLSGKRISAKNGRRASNRSDLGAQSGALYDEFLVQDDKPIDPELNGMGEKTGRSTPRLVDISLLPRGRSETFWMDHAVEPVGAIFESDHGKSVRVLCVKWWDILR